MGVIGEFLDHAARAARNGLPPVAAAYFPPARRDLGRDAEFCLVQLEDGSTGAGFTLLGDTLERLHVRGTAQLRGADPLALARGLASPDGVDRAIGIAALNAITQHAFRAAGFAPPQASNSFGALRLEPGVPLGMVGLFPPLARRAQANGVPLVVIELRPELARTAPGLVVTPEPARLAECAQIVCTSAVLLNDTLDAVLAHARHAHDLVIIGPSASCFPDPLFERGVTAVAGYWTVQPQALLSRATALEPWGDAGYKCVLDRRSYPGTGALLARRP